MDKGGDTPFFLNILVNRFLVDRGGGMSGGGSGGARGKLMEGGWRWSEAFTVGWVVSGRAGETGRRREVQGVAPNSRKESSRLARALAEAAREPFAGVEGRTSIGSRKARLMTSKPRFANFATFASVPASRMVVGITECTFRL